MDVSKVGVHSHFTKGMARTGRQAVENATQDKLKNAVTLEVESAAKVDISPEGRLALLKELQFKEYNPATSYLKIDEGFFSHEAHTQIKADFAEGINNRTEIDPFDNEFQMLAVHATFLKGSLEHFIQGAIDGKARNSSLVASELGQMIRSAAYNNGATAEERAVLRETGMKHAKYIAQNFFENPNEAKAFLDGIKRFYDNDVLREKGYTVLEGPGSPYIFKPYTSPHNGEININEFAKKYGVIDVKSLLSDPVKWTGFTSALSRNKEKWSEEIIKAFEDNAQNVTNIINLVKSSLNEESVTSSMARILKAF